MISFTLPGSEGSLPSDLAYLVQVQERTEPFRIVVKKQVTSTNDIARGWAEPYGVVVADAQSRGRGRLQRSWHSPEGKNIYMTVIVPLPAGFPSAALLPATVAVAIRNALLEFIPKHAHELFLKWPNDLYLQGRKLCGILIERIRDELFGAGIGINVNMTEKDFPSELRDRACSLCSVTGKTFHRGHLIETVLGWLLKYRTTLVQNPLSVVQEFNSNSLTTGAQVVITTGKDRFRAYALGMTPDGALEVRTEEGKKTRITSSDVEVVLGQ